MPYWCNGFFLIKSRKSIRFCSMCDFIAKDAFSKTLIFQFGLEMLQYFQTHLIV